MKDSDRRWVDSMAEAYERHLVPAVFAPFARDLADRAARLQPARILELAAGTGVLTAALRAKLPSARLTATDFNEAMVALGERRAPDAVWRAADATDLPFEDGVFDMVICQFGVMFFPDKRAASSEATRVLADGGSYLLNAWGPIEAHGFQAAVVAACNRLFPDDPPVFIGSVPHFYADVSHLVTDLEGGGLRVVDVDEVVLEGSGGSAMDVAAGYCFGTPLRGEIESRGGDFDTVVAAIALELKERLGPDELTARMSAHVVTGTPDR
jgi:SAM-dependent methyltransferase